MPRPPYLAGFLLCLATAIAAQTPPEAARDYIAGHRAELVQQFSELLSIPNVAADPANLKRNADLLEAFISKVFVEQPRQCFQDWCRLPPKNLANTWASVN